MEDWHRRSIRLPGYDYTQPGAYYVTICTQDRECLLADVTGDTVTLSTYGEIVQRAWEGLPDHYANLGLDAFVIMPNHIHGVLVLTEVARTSSERVHGLPEIVRAFKSFSARAVNDARGTPQNPVWQRNYYEHIVRDDDEWERIREYIAANPVNWEDDPENPLLVTP